MNWKIPKKVHFDSSTYTLRHISTHEYVRAISGNRSTNQMTVAALMTLSLIDSS